MYKIPCKLTDSSRLQYVIMTTNNRYYLFSKWRAVVRRASPSHASYYNWWPSLKWIQWTLAGIRMQVINSYFRGYIQYCVLPNNFSIMLEKMTTHRIIRYGSWFTSICRAYPYWKAFAKQIWRIFHHSVNGPNWRFKFNPTLLVALRIILLFILSLYFRSFNLSSLSYRSYELTE